ncbi:DUF1801 domain-containing protein [Fusibacter bizertensis]
MHSDASTVDNYIKALPQERQEPMERLRGIFKKELEALGFEEGMGYGMISYWVPFSLYPQGYHCKPEQPLPFLSIASQKNFIAVYHLAIYSDETLLQWFQAQYPKYTTAKLDMGKSCIRFKKSSTIPYELFDILAKKISATDWIKLYEKMLRDN